MKINGKYLSFVLIAVILIGTSVLSIPQNAFATTNLASNGSFENPNSCSSPFTTLNSPSTTITGWTVGGQSIDWICGYWAASDGTKSIDLSGNAAGSVSQDLTTIPGATYAVTFDMSGNTDGGNTIKQLTATAPGYSQPHTYDTTGHHSGTNWVQHSFSFTATGTISTLSFTSNELNPYGPALDNVNVVLSKCPAGFVPGERDNTCVPSNTSIPEFPFSFSLVIIFVAVTAVYLGIRQKMIPGFKSF
ncbi:MAG TPA: choice-of-anchor C family protein [Nitrosopumilaceae archaeon]|nr:choice-of-anchor C family protein [Nitrosopumilaceae archaeon]